MEIFHASPWAFTAHEFQEAQPRHIQTAQKTRVRLPIVEVFHGASHRHSQGMSARRPLQVPSRLHRKHEFTQVCLCCCSLWTAQETRVCLPLVRIRQAHKRRIRSETCKGSARLTKHASNELGQRLWSVASKLILQSLREGSSQQPARVRPSCRVSCADLQEFARGILVRRPIVFAQRGIFFWNMSSG